MALVRSISGLRAEFPNDLTIQLVTEYALGFATLLPPGEIIIGRDGRPSGKWIEQAVIAALVSTGRKVINIGIAPTPTVQLLVEKRNASGGIAITASHNPQQWNGMKFIDADGTFLWKEKNETLWDIIDKKAFTIEYRDEFPEVTNLVNSENEHFESLISTGLLNQLKIDEIMKNKFKIVIDAVNASGSVFVPILLEKLGCEVIKLHCNKTGIFPHTPEPLPENLTELAKEVKKSNADIGIAVDPDADRLVIIDESGEPIGEELTICLATDYILSNYKLLENKFEKNVVVNFSTTMLVDYLCNKHNAKLYRSPVGEINVVNKMKTVNAIIGGEGSGGVILPACHYGRDSLVGIFILLLLLTEKGKKLSEIVNEYPKYKILKTKMPFEGSIDEFTNKLQKLFPNDNINTEDGIRITNPNYWVQLRKSNTEPIIRIIAEAENENTAKELIEKAAEIIK